MRPIAGALSVVLDPIIRVRFPGDPEDLAVLWEKYEAGEELIKLAQMIDDQPDEPVRGTLQRGGDRMLFFEPDRGLATGRRYRLSVASPDTSALTVTEFGKFETGYRQDEELPELVVSDDEMSLYVSDTSPECGPEGSVNVGIDFTPATDDGDPTSIEHFVYLTRARGLEAPRLLARVGEPYERPNLSFVLSPEEAKAPVCIRIRAVDGRLQMAENEPEICFDPVQGSFFRPLCSVAAPGHPAGGSDSQSTGLFLLLSALVWRLRRRHTSPDGPARTTHRNRPHAQ